MPQRQSVVQGERVMLCPMGACDQPHFQRWLSEQPDLRALIDDPHIPTLEDQERWFERSQKPDRCLFSLVTVPEDVLIGNAGFVDIDPTEHSAQFRITIGHPDYRGRGLGQEAMLLLLQYGFETMGLARVWLKVRTDNTAALALYERMRFMVREEYPAQSGHGAGMVMEMDASTFSRSPLCP